MTELREKIYQCVMDDMGDPHDATDRILALVAEALLNDIDRLIEVAAKAIKDAEYDYQTNGYPMEDKYLWIAASVVRALDIPAEVTRGYSAGMRDAEMIHYQAIERMSR